MIKGIFGDKEFKRDRNKIYIDDVRTPDDIDVIIELSKLKDKDSLNFYKKMKDDFNYIYNKNLINMNDKNDKCNFACFFVNNEKYQFFIIKLGEKVIGELYTAMEGYSTYFLEEELAKMNIEIKRFTNLSYLLFFTKERIIFLFSNSLLKF